MASNSGWTDVLVEGASTPNLPRGASGSGMELECHVFRGGRHDDARGVRPEAQVPDRAVERAGARLGSEGARSERGDACAIRKAARAVRRAARRGDGGAAPPAGRIG